MALRVVFHSVFLLNSAESVGMNSFILLGIVALVTQLVCTKLTLSEQPIVISHRQAGGQVAQHVTPHKAFSYS